MQKGTTHSYQQLKEVILQDFPAHKNQLPWEAKAVLARWELSIEDDMILHGCRLLILIAMQKRS